MQAISELKEQAVTDTPLIVFDCVLSNGQPNTGARTPSRAGGSRYTARVIQHSSFDIQTASDQGIDGSPQISIVLANADSHFSEIERPLAGRARGSRLVSCSTICETTSR